MALVRATARYVRTSPTKVRQLARLIKGEHVAEARRILEFSGKGAAQPLLKVLDSAVANAEHNDGLDPDRLWVERAYVDEGPTLKRWRPRALGRATRVRKRTSHITVVVGTRALRPTGTRRERSAGRPAGAAARDQE